jgi:peptide/nickel transport system substrate-binding protein
MSSPRAVVSLVDGVNRKIERMNSRWKNSLFAAVASACLIGVLAPASAAGTLLIAREADSTTFDPIATQQNPDCWIYPNIFAGLVKANVEGTTIEPNLAESWTSSPDGLTYTFKLRPGLKFSDGSPLKASDVRFSILRARDTKESAWNSLYTGIADVVPKDDTTVVFTLKAPSAVFLANIAMFAAVVLPEAALTKMGEEAFAQKPVVSGAFVVDEWKHGDRVILKKNPNYWNAGHVSLDRVEWIIVANDNTRILKLQAKEVDAAIILPFNRVAELQKTPGLTVHLDASTREDFLIMNEGRKPFDNVDVRKAINMALDRKAIVEAVTFGIGEVANSFISKGALYY